MEKSEFRALIEHYFLRGKLIKETEDHKRTLKINLHNVVASEQCLGMFQSNSKEFLRRYVTVDETWIHYYTPETKSQLKMWTGPVESAPKKRRWFHQPVR